MLIKYADTDKASNPYVDKGIIPLGISSGEGGLIYKIYPSKSDSMVITSKPGRGKSVINKNMYYFLTLGERQIIVYDWEGEDHKLSYFANNSDDGLAPGMGSSPVHNATFYAYGKKKDPFEVQIRPNLRSYAIDELGAIGFSVSAAKEVKQLLQDNPKIRSLWQLLEHCEKIPTGNEPGSTNFSTKQSLLKNLAVLISEDVFSLDSQEFNIIKALEEGKNLFFNFGGNINLARVEIMRQVNQIIDWRKDHPDKVPPCLIYEESDALFPRTPKAEEKPLVNRGIYSLLRGRKLSLGQYFICPSFHNLHPKIGAACNEMIIGQMEGKDRNALHDLKKDERLQEQVQSLQWDERRNIREFIYINELGNKFVFNPFMCPQMPHKEFGVN